MARKSLFEQRAKQLLLSALDLPYSGIRVTPQSVEEDVHALSDTTTYVVKVDVGIKKRFKQGLVLLDQPKERLADCVEEFSAKGYTSCIIEPYVAHSPDEEKYFALERVREGIRMYYSASGGVDIESSEGVSQALVSDQALHKVSETLSVPLLLLEKIIKTFDDYYLSFLEINPLLVQGEEVIFLDVAAEVDDAAAFFITDGWIAADFTSGAKKEKTEEEVSIDQLSEQSQASFRLEVLNPQGSIFMLLSGGGASIVLADEVGNLGYGEELANYGEYSGNPNAEETYVYTKQLLQVLLKSSAKKKVLIIGGGVANFTDVRVTFQGLIKAIGEVSDTLRKQQVKVYVRRGGPHQDEGLTTMKSFLEKETLLGMVAGPEKPLTSIVSPALKEVKHA